MIKLKQKSVEIKNEKALAKKRRKNKNRTKKIINIILLFLLVIIVLLLIFSWIKRINVDSKYDSFAKCLSTKAVMYGTEWCTNCQDQKRIFGKSFKYVSYINCDSNLVACNNLKISAYPTWVLSDGEKLVGKQSFYILSNKSGCVLP